MKRFIVIPAIVGSLLAGCPVVANASPYPNKEKQFCKELDNNDSEDGVLAAIFRIGLTTPDIDTDGIAAITVDAVTKVCPKHQLTVVNVMKKYDKKDILA